MTNIDYRLYLDSDVHAVVQMWRRSRDGWPPGFFGASKISASSAEQEEKGSGKLFTVLALSQDEVVGFCRTSPYGGEPDASYIDLINVVPEMHGRGIGKHLLLDALERSVSFGMKRVDLHTWPANMKAVPLYKKTGFCWVPDTMVYMQNYIPALLSLKRFREFLGDDDWYHLLCRDLTVEPDRAETESGREVFRYMFKRDGNTFQAEFDKQGRCLSAIESPGFKTGLMVDRGASYFAGRPVRLRIDGCAGRDIAVSSADSMNCQRIAEDTLEVVPRTVRIPRGTGEPADKVSVSLDDLDLAIGMHVSEEVSLYNTPFRFVKTGCEEVHVGVKCLGNVESAAVSYSVDGGERIQKVFSLGKTLYQNLTLEFPALDEGIHLLKLQIGRTGYKETVVIVAGYHTGAPVTHETRRCMVVVGRDTVMTVSAKGASVALYTRGDHGGALRIGGYRVGAGPPAWNSDLPRQIYKLDSSGGCVTGKTAWPSKPGVEFAFKAWLDKSGFSASKAFLTNGSEAEKKLNFRANTSFSDALEPKTDLLPVDDGLLKVKRVYNQVPDWDEDLSPKVSGLSAPWTGVEGEGFAAMNYFHGWTELEYDMPGTRDIIVQSGETVESPEFRMMVGRGDHRALLAKADFLGWETGRWRNAVDFARTNLRPIMTEGAKISLTHPLHGERDACLSVNGKRLGFGGVNREKTISADLSATGKSQVQLDIAGITTVKPVYVVRSSSSVESAREGDGLCRLSNHRVRILLDPSSRGHVYSVVLDGVEYIKSAHPEPGEFAWEKPWFGGILPEYQNSHGRPFPLEEHIPLVERYECDKEGLTESGWQISWEIDHKEYGSVQLVWKAGLLPEIPVLNTELLCRALKGEYMDGGFHLRGFLQPGGSTDHSVLTCQGYPGLAQGRNHAGAWRPLGKWARVTRGSSFVEAYPGCEGSFLAEDYGKLGCHLGVFATHRREKRINARWLFGTSSGIDGVLAETLRSYC